MADAFERMQLLKNAGADIQPVLSYHAADLDTRFITSEDLKAKLHEITGREAIESIPAAEPIGPQKTLDIVLVLPCTGSTIAKIALGITDTPATMAVKAHLRNERPVVIAISSNDGLSANAKNIGALLNTRNIYFVPFYQDDPVKKSRSLAYHGPSVVAALEEALDGRQTQPVLYR
jgi:dipicolinate synthase subunit B